MSTPEQRAACAQAFVDDWKERGHQAIAVVHMHGHDKDRPQPHLHVLATGRPWAPMARWTARRPCGGTGTR